jgi:hypothetical protein
MSENTERAIKNGQSRETGNIGYTRQRKTKQKHNTICVWHHHTQRNTYNVNKTWALWQTTEPNIVLMRNSYQTSQHATHNVQTLNRTTQTAKINVREYRRGNYKRTIQRNWQHRLHKKKKNKTYTWQWKGNGSGCVMVIVITWASSAEYRGFVSH